MSAYILLMFLGGYYGGPATAEFANQASCEAAITAGKEKWTTFEGMCVPKQVQDPRVKP
jgi:hypothetical protein